MAIKSNIRVEFLITLVQARPVLWDKTLESYKDKILTKSAWNEICKELYPGFERINNSERKEISKEVMKKWWNIRDGFVKSRKKQREATKSGVEVKKYVYSDLLHFLRSVVDIRQTTNRLSDNYNLKEELITECSSQEDTNEGNISFKKRRISSQKRNLHLLQIQNNRNQGISTFKAPRICSRKRKKDPVVLKIMEFLEEPDNRHLLFFKSVLPSVNNFDEDQTMEYQMGVLQLISNIKQQKPVQQSPVYHCSRLCCSQVLT